MSAAKNPSAPLRPLHCRHRASLADGLVHSRLTSHFPHLVCRLVLAQADVDRVAQKVVSRPGQIGDLCDKLRLDPMHARKNERRSEAGLA